MRPRSRFGKLVKVHFDASGKIVGANTRNYLLEKQRVTHPPENERGYHIYYMLLTSAPECAARKLGKVRPPQGPLPPRHAFARAPYTLLALADPVPRRSR